MTACATALAIAEKTARAERRAGCDLLGYELAGASMRMTAAPAGERFHGSMVTIFAATGAAGF